MHLRLYDVADREACLGLFDSNVPAFFAPHEREDFQSFLADLERLPIRYFVLVDGGRAIACGGVGRRDDEARMCWGIVHGLRHGEGLGRIMLLARLVMGARLGATRAGLDTIPKVAPFFEREGFVITGGTDDYYGPGIHRRDLVLPLDDVTVARLRERLHTLATEKLTFDAGTLDKA